MLCTLSGVCHSSSSYWTSFQCSEYNPFGFRVQNIIPLDSVFSVTLWANVYVSQGWYHLLSAIVTALSFTLFFFFKRLNVKIGNRCFLKVRRKNYNILACLQKPKIGTNQSEISILKKPRIGMNQSKILFWIRITYLF